MHKVDTVIDIGNNESRPSVGLKLATNLFINRQPGTILFEQCGTEWLQEAGPASATGNYVKSS